MASRSLGTLTLDLIAQVGGFVAGMDKAARESEKRLKKIQKTAEQVGKKIAAGIAAGVAGLTALVVQGVTASREIENLSRLANTNAETFQRWAYAARTVGVEQDKVGDILKDVQDKVGDFLTTGGGGMADFFETIAPKVGVTAEQFRTLSGPDALQLYVSSLEKANVSQAEMVFYLEALAGDAALLAPLLQNDGRLLSALGDDAERLGNVLSDLDIQRLSETDGAFRTLRSSIAGIKNDLVVSLAPTIEKLAKDFSEPAFLDSVRAFANLMIDVTTTLVRYGPDLLRIFAAIKGGLLGFAAGTPFGPIGQLIGTAAGASAGMAFPEIGGAILSLSRGIDTRNRELSGLRESMTRLRDSGAMADVPQWRIGTSGSQGAGAMSGGADPAAQRTALDGIRAMTLALREQAETFGMNETQIVAWKLQHGDLAEQFKTAGAAAEPLRQQILAYTQQLVDLNREHEKKEAIEEYLTALRDQVATLDLGEGELIDYRLALLGASDAQRAQAAALRESIEAWNAQQEAVARAKQIYEETRTPLERLQQQIAEANNARLFGGLDDESYRRQIQALQDEFDQSLDAASDAMSVFADEASREIQRTFADLLFQPFSEGLDGMVRDFALAMQRIAANRLAENLLDMFGNWGSANSGAGGLLGLVAQGAQALFGGKAWGGPVSAGGIYPVNERGPELLSIGAKDYLMMGGAGGMVTPSEKLGGSPNIRIVNAYDASHVYDYMGSSAGEQVIVNAVRKNQAMIRQIAAGQLV